MWPREVYLGRYGSAESRERYDDLIAEWLCKNGDVTRYTLTIADLCILSCSMPSSTTGRTARQQMK